MHGYDAQIEHDYRMTKWWTKIRKGNGLNGHNGTHTGECDLGGGWRGLRPEARGGLPDATAAAIVNSREDWPQQKITVGLSSASLSRAAGSPWQRGPGSFRGNTEGDSAANRASSPRSGSSSPPRPHATIIHF
jgi:hypothetical protein